MRGVRHIQDELSPFQSALCLTMFWGVGQMPDPTPKFPQSLTISPEGLILSCTRGRIPLKF